MTCHNCQIKAKKFGRDRKGNQRFRCLSCRKTFQEPKDKPLDTVLEVKRFSFPGRTVCRSSEHRRRCAPTCASPPR
jgi:transposase-like protein